MSVAYDNKKKPLHNIPSIKWLGDKNPIQRNAMCMGVSVNEKAPKSFTFIL